MSQEKKCDKCGVIWLKHDKCSSPIVEEREGFDDQQILMAVKKWKEELPFMDSLIQRTVGELRYKDFINSLYSMILSYRNQTLSKEGKTLQDSTNQEPVEKPLLNKSNIM